MGRVAAVVVVAALAGLPALAESPGFEPPPETSPELMSEVPPEDSPELMSEPPPEPQPESFEPVPELGVEPTPHPSDGGDEPSAYYQRWGCGCTVGGARGDTAVAWFALAIAVPLLARRIRARRLV